MKFEFLNPCKFSIRVLKANACYNKNTCFFLINYYIDAGKILSSFKSGYNSNPNE